MIVYARIIKCDLDAQMITAIIITVLIGSAVCIYLKCI